MAGAVILIFLLHLRSTVSVIVTLPLSSRVLLPTDVSLRR